MAKKTKKAKTKKEKKSRRIIYVILALTLTYLVLLSLYFYFASSAKRVSSLIYEEIFSSKDGLSEGIRQANYAIYESIRLSGLATTDVSFLDVQPKYQNGNVWDHTEILVSCPDRQTVIGLYKRISESLAELDAHINLHKEEAPDGIICHIFVSDFYTHKVILRFDGQRPHIMDVRPRVAIIIDDLGYDRRIAFSFLHLDFPLSFSVLPYAPFTKAIVKEASKERRELLLHLPMEAKNPPTVGPGPGALFLSMDDEKIRQVFADNLEQIDGARGVNNHMGSAFTENRKKMLVVLKELKERNLFFIDSRTTDASVGLELAQKIGLPAASRRVFLDNDQATRAIEIQIERLMSAARRSGAAIGIGHPHKETLEVIKQYAPIMSKEFQLVPVSELVR